MLGPEEVTEVFVNRREVEDNVQQMFGIIPRATQQIFNLVAEGMKQGTEYTIKCSYIEIYNEMINDILCNPVGENLRLRELPKLGMSVMDMTERFITQPEEVFDCLSTGTANRIVCATGQNARSSRSHTVFVIVIEQKLADGSNKISKLNLVDLAGSEKLSKTGATGQALKEAQNINLSLTTLGRCIKALTSAKEGHVPFRESKLTLILKESLGGNSKTSLLCTASGKLVHKEETLGTFAFAERAKQIKSKAQSNVTRSAEELMQIVEQLKVEVTNLRKQLKSRQENPSMPISAGAEEGAAAPTQDDELPFRFTELQVQHERLQESSVKEIERLQFELERASQLSANPLVVRELEDEVLELKQEKQRIEEEAEKVRFSLQTQVDDLTVAIQDNASILFNYQEELMTFEEKLAETKDSLLENESQLKQALEVKELLEKEYEIKKNEAGSLRSELLSSAENIEKLEMSLSDFKQQVVAKDQLLNSLQEDLLTKEGELSLLKLEESKLRSSLQQLEQDKASYELRYEELKAQNEEFRVEVATANKKLQAFEAAYAKEKLDFQSQRDEQARELALAQSKAQALELELQENRLTHSQIEEREVLIAKLHETHENELKKISKEQTEVRLRHEEAIMTLQGKLEDEKNNYEELRSKAEGDRMEFAMRIEAIEIAQQATAHQNIELEYTIKKLQQELATALGHNASLTDALKEQKAEFDANLRSNRELMMRHSITLQTVKAISNSHSRKLEEVYKELSDTKLEVNTVQLNAHKELSQAQEEADKLRTELKHIKQQLGLKESTIEELRKKAIELEKTLGSQDLRLKQITEEQMKELSKPVSIHSAPSQPAFTRRGSIVPKVNRWGVSLKPVGNGLLEDARKEAINSAMQAPASTKYKVDYGIDMIKLLYANTEAIEQEALAKAQAEESKR
mmetsp:Transcript_28628/g.50903  ORF Transcript_28628/g.50903 Transcript_28628/m.50903 type:complete len:921 (-) Transcript_28628:14-2776(-)